MSFPRCAALFDCWPYSPRVCLSNRRRGDRKHSCLWRKDMPIATKISNRDIFKKDLQIAFDASYSYWRSHQSVFFAALPWRAIARQANDWRARPLDTYSLSAVRFAISLMSNTYASYPDRLVAVSDAEEMGLVARERRVSPRRGIDTASKFSCSVCFGWIMASTW